MSSSPKGKSGPAGEGAYVVLARKYRPQKFSEVVGQEPVSLTLKNAVASGKIAHAFLFTGPRGVGKTTMARLLSKALNCAKGPTPEPCGECHACREIAASSCLDVMEMDAASHTGVDNIRQAILDTVSLAPSRDRYRIFIIDETHMLSTAAFNALLKTLEEPPAHIVFILATTESTKVPATIVSRCQRFRFRPIPPELLAEQLGGIAGKEGIDVEPGALSVVARQADGSLRDALGLLDQCRVFGEKKLSEEAAREMLGLLPSEMIEGVVVALVLKDAAALARQLKEIYEEGIEPAQVLRDVRAAFEDAYLSKLGIEAGGGKEGASARASEKHLAYLLRRMNKALEEIRYGDNPRLVLELALFGCLDAAGDLSAWLARLEALEKRLASGGARAPAPEAPSAAPSAPAPQAPRPDSPREVEGESSGLWPRILAAVREEKMALAAALEGARLVDSGDAWTIEVGKSYERDQAQKNAAYLSGKIALASGVEKPLKIELSLVKPPEAGAPAPALSPEMQAGLKAASDILGGRVKVIPHKRKS